MTTDTLCPANQKNPGCFIWGQSGKHMLDLRFTGGDPEWTFATSNHFQAFCS
jgi:hypothetical protein